ncbi:hypothetical protein AB1K32_07665 [Metabacillus dongyingensis]
MKSVAKRSLDKILLDLYKSAIKDNDEQDIRKYEREILKEMAK